MGEVTKEMIEAVPRRTARELLANVPGGPEYDRAVLAVEIALNTEWWRGYFAGSDEAKASAEIANAKSH